MKATAQSPPVTQPKEKLLHRMIRKCIPRKYRDQYNPLVLIVGTVCWNLSSVFTALQILVVQKWQLISGWVTSVFIPAATKFWDDLLNGLRVLSDLIASTT